jgi:hypothetical protein
MQQIPLDIGLAPTPELRRFLSGPNETALMQVQAWLAHSGADPLPLYLWGAGQQRQKLFAARRPARAGCPGAKNRLDGQ